MAARKCQKMNANAKPGQGQIAERDIKECGRPRPPASNEVGEDAHAPWFFAITPPSNFFSKIRHEFFYHSPFPVSAFRSPVSSLPGFHLPGHAMDWHDFWACFFAKKFAFFLALVLKKVDIFSVC